MIPRQPRLHQFEGEGVIVGILGRVSVTHPPTAEKFDGRPIRRARCELGLTRTQLGWLVGSGKWLVRDWEARGRRPSETVRYRLARLLDLALDDVGGDPAV